MRLLQPVQQFDLVLFHWCMARPRRHMLTALGRAISKTADGWLYVLFAAVYGALDWAHHSSFIKYLVIAYGIERVIYFVAKNSFRRSRPADAISGFDSFIIPSDKFSFPSGHTSAAFLFAIFLASQFTFLLPFLLIWGCCVASSRVFLGVHFPTDTLVGALLGMTVGLTTLAIGGLI